MVNFFANRVVADHSGDADVIMVAFADEVQGRPRDSLILQRAQDPDIDRALSGIDEVYIERNGQSRGGYGGILRFLLDRDRVRVELGPAMGTTLGASVFEIQFSIDDGTFDGLRESLRRLFLGWEHYGER